MFIKCLKHKICSAFTARLTCRWRKWTYRLVWVLIFSAWQGDLL